MKKKIEKILEALYREKKILIDKLNFWAKSGTSADFIKKEVDKIFEKLIPINIRIFTLEGILSK